MTWRIGGDSGGTFTDICLFDESTGRIAVWKVASTPAVPSEAVVQGVGEALSRSAVEDGDVSYFGHGTTVATNALIQHRGARTGLIVAWTVNTAHHADFADRGHAHIYQIP